MKRLTLAILLALLAVALLPVGATAEPSENRWEFYSTGDDGSQKIYGNVWAGQTFTVTPESHSITRVRLRVYREGTPGTVTVSIRETDAGNLPTGQDITSGTFDGDVVTTATGGLWQTIDLTQIRLDYNEVYAIVVRAEAGDIANAIHIRVDGSSPTYADGNVVTSSTGGGSWGATTSEDAMFEVWGRGFLEVKQARAFSGYIEDDDLLFVLQYFNTYTPYYPINDPVYHFGIQLRTASGSTVLAQTPCRAWGNKPTGIYLSAEQASALTVGAAYRLYIYGDVSEEPNAYYTLTAADWRGTDMTLLDSWVLGTARDIADYYNVDLTTYIQTGEVLNEEGGVIFATGVPALVTQRPGIFEVTIWKPEYERREGTTDFDDAAAWEDQVGSTAADTMTGIGNIWGISGRNAGAFGLLAGFLILCLVIVGRGGDAFGAALLAIPVVLLGTELRLLDISHIAIVAAVGILLTVYRFWFART